MRMEAVRVRGSLSIEQQIMCRVMIAEDERLVAFVLRRQLEAQGYQVIGIAANGLEAIELCRSGSPDVVLMDIQMPEMDGIVATEQIMREKPTCIVIVSADGTAERIAAAEKAGAMAYLVKPVSDQQLSETIGEALIRFSKKHHKS